MSDVPDSSGDMLRPGSGVGDRADGGPLADPARAAGMLPARAAEGAAAAAAAAGSPTDDAALVGPSLPPAPAPGAPALTAAAALAAAFCFELVCGAFCQRTQPTGAASLKPRALTGCPGRRMS